MLFGISNQLTYLLASVIARAFVFHFPKHSLYRIRLRTISRQKQLYSWMLFEPLCYDLRFMNSEVVYYYIGRTGGKLR